MFDAPPTPFDLNFRLFGFPVRVSPWFWVAALFLGWPLLRAGVGPAALAIWVACMFGSILLHELGHAVLFRWYGAWATRIVLHGFGGYAQAERQPVSRWKRIAIAFAGPGAQFALLGLLVASNRLTDWAGTNLYTVLTYSILVSINLWWPLLNLLPIWPLDGGRVCRELFFLARVPKAEVRALTVSLATAAGLFVVAVLDSMGKLPPDLADRMPFHFNEISILFLGLFAFQSYQLLQVANRAYAWDDGPYDRGGRWRP